METFCRTVGDLDRSIEFYCDALGFELDMVDGVAAIDANDARGGRRAILTLGSEVVELVECPGQPAAARSIDVAGAASLGFQHIAIVAADMAQAFARLMRFSPHAISNDRPIRLPPSTGGVTAFKFRDPDGHPLELLHFPAGVGDARWHRQDAGEATVGIDHSAIVVGRAESSIAFYDGLLGFSTASRRINQGREQDALDGTAGVVVDVVALTADEPRTPHLELLGYRHPAPRDGSSASPPRPGSADVIVWAVDGLADILARLAAAGLRRSENPLVGSFRGDARVVDPDGHVHALVERAE